MRHCDEIVFYTVVCHASKLEVKEKVTAMTDLSHDSDSDSAPELVKSEARVCKSDTAIGIMISHIPNSINVLEENITKNPVVYVTSPSEPSMGNVVRPGRPTYQSDSGQSSHRRRICQNSQRQVQG